MTMRSAESWAEHLFRSLGDDPSLIETITRTTKLMAEVQQDALRAAAEVCRSIESQWLAVAERNGNNAADLGRSVGAGSCATAIESLIPSPRSEAPTVEGDKT